MIIAMLRRTMCSFALVLCIQAGCGPEGPDLGPFGLVSGTVTSQGEPVKAGMITFNNPNSGQVATANLNSDGTYTMELEGREGLPIGDYNVAIRPPLKVNTESDPSLMRRNSIYDPNVSPEIPMRYRYESKSGLESKVLEGENRFDFDMTPGE